MRALSVLLASALAAAVPCAAMAGWEDGAAAYQRKDWTTAAQELKPLADAGHPGALVRLGIMTLHGHGVAKDEAAALKMLRQAAEKGDAAAQNTLGRLYFTGVGTPRDLNQAVVWFSRAADQGQPNALNNLGQLYFSGNGVAKDEVKAVALLRQAADKGVPASWEALGMAYWDGRGVTADRAEALHWFRKAAERGLVLSQNRLGTALWSGDGVAKNPAEAVRWFEQAAAQGNAASLNNASVAYRLGIGVGKDAEKAALYAILAARLANAQERDRLEQARDKLRQTTDASVWSAAETKAREWRSKSGAAADAIQGDVAAARPAAPPRPKLNAGSGLIVNRDGTVLTNSHVVESCRNIRVTLEGQDPQAATVVARDGGNDLAVLKVSLRPTDVARFREDKAMRAGDSVVAIGYPLSSLLSREPNVTAGLISAMAGIKGDKRHYQITAPVQKGSSGGPLADMSGNVVGIVSAKLNAMKVADKIGDLPQNVNFAIKADLARQFLTDHGVSYETAPASAQLSPADVGDIVRKVTVFVECEG